MAWHARRAPAMPPACTACRAQQAAQVWGSLDPWVSPGLWASLPLLRPLRLVAVVSLQWLAVPRCLPWAVVQAVRAVQAVQVVPCGHARRRPIYVSLRARWARRQARASRSRWPSARHARAAFRWVTRGSSCRATATQTQSSVCCAPLLVKGALGSILQYVHAPCMLSLPCRPPELDWITDQPTLTLKP